MNTLEKINQAAWLVILVAISIPLFFVIALLAFAAPKSNVSHE